VKTQTPPVIKYRVTEREVVSWQFLTCGEYAQFIEDGGYRRPELWLSLGWQTVCEQQWESPLYWFLQDGHWHHFTLAGSRVVDPESPVCHVSYFEADAFARWAGHRLPTEAEWEVASADVPIIGNFADTLLDRREALHPSASVVDANVPSGVFGDVWEWTSSPYTAYPGYRAPEGALGEYNGKFMCNQYVLRGGSCATPSDHIRHSYRNFFPPETRWQFSGIRVARGLGQLTLSLSNKQNKTARGARK
jgi:ergothioneine biosynthesis protein EgtB